MTEPKRPSRRGRPRAPKTPDSVGDENPYLDAPERSPAPEPPVARAEPVAPPPAPRPPRPTAPPPEVVVERNASDQLERIQRMEQMDRLERAERASRQEPRPDARPEPRTDGRPPRQDRPDRPPRGRGGERGPRPDRPERGAERTEGAPGDDRSFRRNGRRGRNRFRRGGGGGGGGGGAAVAARQRKPAFDRIVTTVTPADGTLLGWFDASRDGGFLRRAINSYLPEPSDPFVPPALVRLHQLRRGDKIEVTYGRDQRGR